MSETVCVMNETVNAIRRRARQRAETCPLVEYPPPVVTDVMLEAGMEVFISNASEDIETALAQAYLAMRVHRPLSEGPQ